MDSDLSETTRITGWRRHSPQPSLPEANASMPVPKGSGFWRKIKSLRQLNATVEINAGKFLIGLMNGVFDK